jgi:hypothetical protein
MSIVTDESNDVAVNGPAVVEIDAERIAWATNLIRGPSKSDQGDMNFDVIAERRAALRRIGPEENHHDYFRTVLLQRR